VPFSLPVLLFSRYADVLGGDRVTVTVPDRATTADVLAAVRALPGAGELPPAPLVAVNQKYAAGDIRVGPGDEVALIPPVAGG
jgi:molybdopterin converting factor small subunit